MTLRDGREHHGYPRWCFDGRIVRRDAMHILFVWYVRIRCFDTVRWGTMMRVARKRRAVAVADDDDVDGADVHEVHNIGNCVYFYAPVTAAILRLVSVGAMGSLGRVAGRSMTCVGIRWWSCHRIRSLEETDRLR